MDPRFRKQKKRLDDNCRHNGKPPVLPSTSQLNIESLSANKICIVSYLANKYNALVILFQETHCTNADQLVIPNYTSAGWIPSRKYGLATFVHERFKWIFADQSLEGWVTEWLCVDVDGCKIVNIYKPPNLQLIPAAILVFQHFCLYSGDFNCWHTDWGYYSISPDGECLANSAAPRTFA